MDAVAGMTGQQLGRRDVQLLLLNVMGEDESHQNQL
jgi:hypothetical protein